MQFAFVSILLLSLALVGAGKPAVEPTVNISAGPSQVEGPQTVAEHPVVGIHHQAGERAPVVVHPHDLSHYASAGPVQAPGLAEVPPVAGPARSRSPEQYGQPESAGLPANYKPFGSWGLYIGGNPADGYYTNYYKALTSSVDKQQAGVVEAKPAATNPSTPLLRQAAVVPPSSSPYLGGDLYSFAYSPSDLAQHHQTQANPPAVPFYGAPSGQGPSPVGLASPAEPTLAPYADFYATKKLGQIAQKEMSPTKMLQRSSYYYQPAPLQMAGAVSAKPQQVVAYPVPVGSQIVGSQPGVEGAFDPYGIHAFTRYAVKPTVVANQQQQTDSTYYYSYPAQQQNVVPSYKQQPIYSYPLSSGYGASPFYGFYGYPMNQLHYSQGMIMPVHEQGQGQQQQPHQALAQPSEPSSMDKPMVEPIDQVKPQK